MVCRAGVDDFSVGPAESAENGEVVVRASLGQAEAAAEGEEDGVGARWSGAVGVVGWRAAGSMARATSRNIVYILLLLM